MKKYYLFEATCELKTMPESVDQIIDGQLSDNWLKLGEYDTEAEAEAALKDTREYAYIRKESGYYLCMADFVAEFEITLDEDGDLADRDLQGTGLTSRMPVIVSYQAGTSRYSDEGVDYMLANVEDPEGEIVELYAEAVNPTWDTEAECCTDDTATYDDLRDAILRQAAQAGIPEDALKFWFEY